MRAYILIFGFLISSSEALAGWFSPNPSEAYFLEKVTVANERCTNAEISFDERASYKIGAVLNPVIDFHSPEGKLIKWPIDFAYRLTIKSAEKVFFQTFKTIQLQRTTGLNFGNIRVPKEAPDNRNLKLELCFTNISPEFDHVYGALTLYINKGAYVRLLD